MTPDEGLMDQWRNLRDDARHKPAARACVNFAYDCDLLTLEQRALWLRRLETCPGHDDEGGRAWCAYCGDMPGTALGA